MKIKNLYLCVTKCIKKNGKRRKDAALFGCHRFMILQSSPKVVFFSHSECADKLWSVFREHDSVI